MVFWFIFGLLNFKARGVGLSPRIHAAGIKLNLPIRHGCFGVIPLLFVLLGGVGPRGVRYLLESTGGFFVRVRCRVLFL